jgi:hypothetical protein
MVRAKSSASALESDLTLLNPWLVANETSGKQSIIGSLAPYHKTIYTAKDLFGLLAVSDLSAMQ